MSLARFWCNRRRLALDKSHDIVGAQAREGDWSVGEPILKKPVDERHVVDNGRFGQAASLTQMVLVLLRPELGWRESTDRYRFGGNDAFTVQKADDMLKGSYIALVGFYLLSAVP